MIQKKAWPYQLFKKQKNLLIVKYYNLFLQNLNIKLILINRIKKLYFKLLSILNLKNLLRYLILMQLDLQLYLIGAKKTKIFLQQNF